MGKVSPMHFSFTDPGDKTECQHNTDFSTGQTEDFAASDPLRDRTSNVVRGLASGKTADNQYSFFSPALNNEIMHGHFLKHFYKKFFKLVSLSRGPQRVPVCQGHQGPTGIV